MNPNTHHNHFLIVHFVRTHTHNLKTKGGIRRCIYRMTALLSAMSNFCVRAGYEMRLGSYGSKQTSQYHFGEQFVCTYTCESKTIAIYGCSAYRTTALVA